MLRIRKIENCPRELFIKLEKKKKKKNYNKKKKKKKIIIIKKQIKKLLDDTLTTCNKSANFHGQFQRKTREKWKSRQQTTGWRLFHRAFTS